MGAWQPLPADLPPEVRHFVEQLRLLKDRTGLSLVALGERTAYSKSSWHRYLNATQPPPRQAVVALCRVAGAGAEAERFGVRWELAVRVWPRTPAPAPAGAPAVGGAGTAAGGGAGGAEGEYGGEYGGEYEDDPTVPWWDLLAEAPAPENAPAGASWASSPRLLLYALVLVLALLLTAVIGAVTLT